MEDLVILSKLIVFAGIVNVWFFRVNKGTRWRGGEAESMQEEFEVYGLSRAMMFMVGTLKVLAAIALVISIWYPFLAIPASAAIGFLRVGAVWMHFRVKDPLKKSLTAAILFLLSAFIWLYSTGLI
ncbi:MAG: DoxX family protein [Robiginitalea sp.]